MLLYHFEYSTGNDTYVVRFRAGRIWQWIADQKEAEVFYHPPSEIIFLGDFLISPREPVDCGVKEAVVWPCKRSI